MMSDPGFHGGKPLPVRRALVDDVYDALLGLLMDRVIDPGARVNIDALARDLDVSPTPIREALARLETEGLVIKRAHKGYLAAQLLDARGMRDLYDLRELLEPEAARRACSRIDDATLEALEVSIARMRAVSAPNDDEHFQDYRQFIAEDLKFHHLIAHSAANPLLADAISRLRAHMHLYRLNFRHDFEDATMREHEHILAAIRDRNSSAAARSMRTHIEQSYRRFEPVLAPRDARPS